MIYSKEKRLLRSEDKEIKVNPVKYYEKLKSSFIKIDTSIKEVYDEFKKFNGFEEKEVLNKLETKELSSALKYTAESSDINFALRDDTAGDSVQKDINNLENAINKFDVKENIVVYRGLGLTYESFKEKLALDELGNSVFQDKAFVSTSLTKSTAEDFAKDVLFEVHLRKGNNCLPLLEETTTKYTSEDEIVLQKDLKMYIIKEEYNAKINKYIVKCII